MNSNPWNEEAIIKVFVREVCMKLCVLQVAESRHLKALVSMAGPDVICVGAGKAAQEVLRVCDKSFA